MEQFRASKNNFSEMFVSYWRWFVSFLGPKSVVLIPLESVDKGVIRPRDKRFKYAMEATKKEDGSYILNLVTSIRSVSPLSL